MSGKHTGSISWNPHWMITSAQGLQRVANELDKNHREAGLSDGQLFQGIVLAGPILLSLATEIALKAWQCSERQGPPDHTHDLLKLFESLKQDTQDLLENMMRNVSPYSVNAWDERMQELDPDLQDMFAARMNPIRDILSDHSDANMRWRFSYEQPWDTFDTGEIDRALTVIINAYDERRCL